MGSGEDYGELRASVGIHLLDFDLFTGNAAQREQAVWRFEMRDEYQPEVSLGNILQINLIELNKADRLGFPMIGLHAWVTFFKHGREERIMAKVTHEPTRRALERLREISADEEAQRLAFVRERALRDDSVSTERGQARGTRGRAARSRRGHDTTHPTERRRDRRPYVHSGPPTGAVPRFCSWIACTSFTRRARSGSGSRSRRRHA